MRGSAAGRILNIIGGTGLVAALLFVAFGVFGQSTQVGDLASHFLPHFGAGALLVALVAVRRAIRLAALAVAVVAACYLVTSPGRMPWQPFDVSSCAAVPVRVLSSNLNRANDRFDGIAHSLAAHDPDVAVYFEVTPRLAEALAEIAARTGYRMSADPQSGHYGSALLSKFPLEDVEFLRLGDGAPKLRARFRAGDWHLRLGGVHMGFPLSAVGRAIQGTETVQIGDFVRAWRRGGEAADGGALVVIGDFNATPWSRTGRAVFAETGLGDRVGLFPGSWPAFLPAWLGIPIDQALVAGNAAVLSANVVDNPGSDHRAILLTIAPKNC
jgi:endonuclease/exonuclease/phosphatase (EEP) superfamily protein YafD